MSNVGDFLHARHPASWRRATLKGLAYVAGWAVVAVPVGVHAFMTDTRATVIASHDATVSPAADGYATLDLGAFLPNLRYPAGSRIGVTIDLGKTNVANYDALVQRYAVIASRPEGEISKVRGLLTDMAIEGALEGAAIGLLCPAVWLLVGRDRRRQLVSRLSWRGAAIGAAIVVVAASAVVFEPWNNPAVPSTVEADTDAGWQSIAELVPETDVPAEAQPLQVQTGLITSGTKSLIQSAFDTYRGSIEFYRTAADNVLGISSELRQPGSDETVAILVSDRHDNVGMDLVVRRLADTAGATVLLDAGDDTSTGKSWEAFSLDSLGEAFQDYEKYAVTGNHDEGPFTSEYLDDLGFTVLTGTAVVGVDGIRLLGDADPRSSGLGSWRTAVATTLTQRGADLADAACASDEAGERISTLLVHDASLGRESLERGCVDLVLAGHLHVQVGPDEVTGHNGLVGATYANGTTGGAAYAFALGSKLRRDAMATLVTYRNGTPVGLQAVTIRTTGDFVVDAYMPLPTDSS